jgi:hypothetical protein
MVKTSSHQVRSKQRRDHYASIPPVSCHKSGFSNPFGDGEATGDHLPLEVVVSSYRAIVAPMINYIEVLHR